MLQSMLLIASLAAVVPQSTQETSRTFFMDNECARALEQKLQNNPDVTWYNAEIITAHNQKSFASDPSPYKGLKVKRDGAYALSVIEEAFSHTSKRCNIFEILPKTSSAKTTVDPDKILRRAHALQKKIDRQLQKLTTHQKHKNQKHHR